VERLRALLPDAAERLRSRGARRVIVFGSLATGAEPHETTDVDLAVEGLDESAIGEATFELEAMFGAKVDLVAIERASSRVAAWISRDGREVGRDVTR